jgi:acyl-CoA thioesterase
MTTPFFDLRATHNPNRWYMPLTEAVCVGPVGNQFMFGGVGLGAAIGALEGTCQRPVIWATAQYLSYARPGSTVDLDVITPVAGKYTSQARVIGHVGDKEIFTVNAALGSRPSEISHQWATTPKAPPAEDCLPGEHWRGDDGGLHSQLDVRLVKGEWGFGHRSGEVSPDGQLLMWIRPRHDLPIDAPMLAVIADHVPSGIGAALGRSAGGNSLDNTIRICRIVPTRWVLCDILINAIHGGFGHGRMHLFAEDGTLLATASQSVIVRMHGGREG